MPLVVSELFACQLMASFAGDCNCAQVVMEVAADDAAEGSTVFKVPLPFTSRFRAFGTPEQSRP